MARRWVGSMEAESYNQTLMVSKSARKRSIKIFDDDSDDSCLASQTSQSSSMSSKTIMSVAGEPKSIKTLRSGDLLIQCAKESHEKKT